MNQINKVFVNFLKDNHVLKQYIKNLKKYHAKRFLTWENHTNPFTIVSLSQGIIHDLINNSFLWYDTPEGGVFWSKLHREWIDKCLSMKLDYHTRI